MKPRRRNEDGFKTFGFRRSRSDERGGRGEPGAEAGTVKTGGVRSKARPSTDGLDEVLDWEESRRPARTGRKEKPGSRRGDKRPRTDREPREEGRPAQRDRRPGRSGREGVKQKVRRDAGSKRPGGDEGKSRAGTIPGEGVARPKKMRKRRGPIGMSPPGGSPGKNGAEKAGPEADSKGWELAQKGIKDELAELAARTREETGEDKTLEPPEVPGPKDDDIEMPGKGPGPVESPRGPEQTEEPVPAPVQRRPEPPAMVAPRPEELVEQGKNQLRNGLHQHALTSFQRALAMKPDDMGVLHEVGTALVELGRLAEAENCFSRILENDPASIEAWVNLGAVRNRGGYGELAVEAFDEAIKLDPKCVDAWMNRGVVKFKMEDFEEAAECFAQVLKIDPDEEDAWTSRGLSLEKMGRDRAALRSYEEAMKLNPANRAAIEGAESVQRSIRMELLKDWPI